METIASFGLFRESDDRALGERRNPPDWPPDVSWNCLLETGENNLFRAGLRSVKRIARNVFVECAAE